MVDRCYPARAGLGLAASLVGAACITVTTVSVSQKTSLERQLMGEMEPLNEEDLLASSVRAAGAVGVGSVEDLQARALAARRRQLFNRDDVDELKAAGCLGEGRSATLLARRCERPIEGLDADAIARIQAEENDDRTAIIDWALAVDPALTPADRPKVVEVYTRLLREQAGAHTWVEEPDGSWARK
ncbi:MAG: DUF1318 domain-containing protein [Deltaproteobacteria bacterium]|nr:DUF1318 domain-containing protein [Deltaproteobacteria bacterium]